MDLERLIEKGAKIIDVRTRAEFMGGNANGSINIPLNEIVDRLDEIRAIKELLILCCTSGNRSGQATGFLSNQEIECHNGGSWFDVNYALSNSSS